MAKVRWAVCVWEGCTAVVIRPDLSDWPWFIDIPPDDREGYVCPEHRDIMRCFWEGEGAGEA